MYNFCHIVFFALPPTMLYRNKTFPYPAFV
jgi:hypothetical protein